MLLFNSSAFAFFLKYFVRLQPDSVLLLPSSYLALYLGYDNDRTEQEVYFCSPVGLRSGSRGTACLFSAAAVTCPHKQQTATRNLEISLFTSCLSLLHLPVSILLFHCLFLGKAQLAFALKRLE